MGELVPLADIVQVARECGSYVLIDAAQLIAHSRINVEKLDVDFLAFSGHKLYGPTGVGVLYAKPELLNQMDPFLGGGDMIQEVATSGSSWADIPRKFEAGTPAISEVIAFGKALDFLEQLSWAQLAEHEKNLVNKTLEELKSEGGITLYGPDQPCSIISFNIDGVHSHDFSTIADGLHVNFRAGHHCTMPLMKHLGVTSTARVSFGLYNTEDDIAPLIESVRKAKSLLL